MPFVFAMADGLWPAMWKRYRVGSIGAMSAMRWFQTTSAACRPPTMFYAICGSAPSMATGDSEPGETASEQQQRTGFGDGGQAFGELETVTRRIENI